MGSVQRMDDYQECAVQCSHCWKYRLDTPLEEETRLMVNRLNIAKCLELIKTADLPPPIQDIHSDSY